MPPATPSAPTFDPATVLAASTPEERVALLDGADLWTTQALPRLGVPSVTMTDGPHGVRLQAGTSDHLDLDDSVPATCFPPAVALASSWDVDLAHRVGQALGAEARAQRVAVLLGPGVNIKRSPLCGRNFEYLSEDPFLAGRLAAGLVTGLQQQGVGASLKHFAVNNQETDRMTVSADVDVRTLREIYLPAFEHVVRTARPWTVMCSYNRVNGVYASQDPWLLSRVLREEWGYTGLVVSDWGAVDDRAAALAAGLDLEMPSSGGVGARRVHEALAAGEIDDADVDRAAGRVLDLVARTLPGLTAGDEPVDLDAHHALAHEAATAGAVLLRNDAGILPIDPAHGGAVAVVGELARSPRYQGAGSSQVHPTRLDDALGALRDALAGRREVAFAPGYVLEDDASDPALVAEAVAAARDAEVVVLFLGLPPSYESEGYDREHMRIPDAQVALLEAVADVNPAVVVVLSNGAAVTMPWQHRARAVLEGWLLGQAGGTATADLLLGRANPSGRLAETLPLRELDAPTVGAFPGELGHVRYGEGVLVGYRWYDTRQMDVAYPFGHGLSYTTFTWSDAHAEVVDAAAGRVDVHVTVTNTGDRAGTETVQVYVADPVCTVQRPAQELKGFVRVPLAPGESRRVRVELDERSFAWWHTGRDAWVVEAGAFEVRVAASSRDVRARLTVGLPGSAAQEPVSATATAQAWLQDPRHGPWLRERLAGTDFALLLEEGSQAQMMRAVPMVRLSRFPGFPVDEDALAEALAP